ncbi:molybdopterin cofactor-binding domain-containing protein, partial [Bradyrhizobium sp.]|uniref:molybdopterin cofactor-binding domain-containing protein n=1 Tax=Bradyrhizobium sp. TaxID=376 RepID=UPI002E05E98C|nr:molybdopterin cofactor-binding domain-containing protein [Bradyrhizobium sp.]
IKITADGSVTAYNGHVDLGTGIRTALGQIVAEELDVSFARVIVVLGDTTRVPDQGPTIASETIQITAVPLRKAAAQARLFLLTRAAARLELPLSDLTIEDGLIHGHNRSVSYGELISGEAIRLELADDVAVKDVGAYTIVGQSVPRVDLPAKATGEPVYVHDMRMPGMLHGRVVRPPYAGVDAGDFVGSSLIAVDETSVRDIPGLVAVIRIGDFVGVVAEREENAVKAAAQLEVSWKSTPTLPDLKELETALRANPSTPRVLIDRGDVDAAIAAAEKAMQRTYVWPYQMHGSIGPSCAVADVRHDGVRVWSGTQNPNPLRADLAILLQRPENEIDVIRMEAAGCYGRNCADDVSADAVLLSRAVGRPVRVQLTREQEHAWEPKGTAQLIDVNGGLNADGSVAGYDFATRYPSNGAPTLALLLTGMIPAVPDIFHMGDRTAIPPYDYDAMRVIAHDMPPIVRASWLRGVSALPNSFAHESYIDELAAEAGVDPIEYRLRYLKDPRAVDLVNAVAKRAEWTSRPVWKQPVAEGDIVRGRGFAYALYVHSKFPGYGAAWSAWIADVAVNKATGDVSVMRVVAGQDSGLMINPDGVRHQIHGNVIQSTSRALMEEVSFDRASVVSREWGAYPIIKFPDIPKIDVLMLPRPDQPPLGVGESASVPSAAAIANAIFDATGVRFRELPFTPERILAGLRGGQPAPQAALPGVAPPRPVPRPHQNPFAKPLGAFASVAAMTAAVVGIAALALPWRSIAPIARPDPAAYSAATIAGGRQLAALGDCAVCHTQANGAINAGGRAIETPFGVIYSTNITPDPETGIGAWSYPAFERAMREGIHRDGRHLYPAFPYNHFAKTSDADLQALYAYLMAQPAVKSVAPENKLAFPFNLRPLMAGWNALFHDNVTFAPIAAKSATWNRGAYLVEGLGHCGACHSPRNALGAEKAEAYLAGGFAEGWEAPPLTSLSQAPIPWSEDELFAYLRTGESRFHGTAAGPMAPVVKELAALRDDDIRAMAVYLASFNGKPIDKPGQEVLAAKLETSTGTRTVSPSSSAGARLYEGACAVCHEVGGAPLFGSRPSLALNSNLHSALPDNLVQVILHGIAAPVSSDLGYMPGFKDSFNDQQIAELVSWLRRQFAPDKPPWTGVEAAIGRARQATAR